ncbi:hypothetical protein TIFTF001_045543 [Ficus carica]|uniref:Uncharacterized protein n=1 Tax=Ficus carica TaxID=3494 RepID=A0AA88CL13_FICCA|nr:hypothetical protein TIFTF001_045543 [Ficus carica]
MTCYAMRSYAKSCYVKYVMSYHAKLISHAMSSHDMPSYAMNYGYAMSMSHVHHD